jgi:DNA polymerase-4
MSITSKPKDFQKLFLDMNSFFASVEQQVQPTLRGLPVGIAPYTGGTGCIIAASREAKNLGIKCGCLVKEARRLYKDVKIIESRPALYMIYHKEIKKVIESFTPHFQVLSVDEFVINLTSHEQNLAAAAKLGQGIKDKILSEVGDFLTCSVGIGPNRFLAKMAGERKKPDGLTIVQLKDLESFYHQIKLLDITGINHRLEFRLKNFGIDSPIDLYHADLPRLRSILDHSGRLWWYRLRGYEIDEYTSSTKTVGHSHVLAPEHRTPLGAKAVLKKLIYKAASRLRADGFLAGGIFVAISFYDGPSFRKGRRVSPFSDTHSFISGAFEMLKDCHWYLNPSYVSVAAFNLTSSKNIQISIFPEIEKSRKISEAMDKIDDDFGVGFIHPASVFSAKDSAPDRIPFGRPRYDIRH